MNNTLKLKHICHSERNAMERRIYSLMTTCTKQKELLSSIINRFFTKFILSTANVFRMTILAKCENFCHSERNAMERRIYFLKTCSRNIIILLTKIDRFFTAFRMTTPFKFHDFCHSECSEAQRRIYSFKTCFMLKKLISALENRSFISFRMTTDFELSYIRQSYEKDISVITFR